MADILCPFFFFFLSFLPPPRARSLIKLSPKSSSSGSSSSSSGRPMSGGQLPGLCAQVGSSLPLAPGSPVLWPWGGRGGEDSSPGVLRNGPSQLGQRGSQRAWAPPTPPPTFLPRVRPPLTHCPWSLRCPSFLVQQEPRSASCCSGGLSLRCGHLSLGLPGPVQGGAGVISWRS